MTDRLSVRANLNTLVRAALPKNDVGKSARGLVGRVQRRANRTRFLAKVVSSGRLPSPARDVLGGDVWRSLRGMACGALCPRRRVGLAVLREPCLFSRRFPCSRHEVTEVREAERGVRRAVFVLRCGGEQLPRALSLLVREDGLRLHREVVRPEFAEVEQSWHQ